jgi:phasin family protein
MQSQQEPDMPANKSTTSAEPPFAQVMGQARQAADEFTRMVSQMKFPAMPDSDALLGAYKRNINALSEANRIAMDGAQTVAKRHMEIMQQTLAELNENIQALASAEAPQAKAAKQAELLKRAYQRAVANTTELSELIQRSNREALDQLNKRFTEAMDEVKRLMEPGAKGD